MSPRGVSRLRTHHLLAAVIRAYPGAGSPKHPVGGTSVSSADWTEDLAFGGRDDQAQRQPQIGTQRNYAIVGQPCQLLRHRCRQSPYPSGELGLLGGEPLEQYKIRVDRRAAGLGMQIGQQVRGGLPWRSRWE